MAEVIVSPELKEEIYKQFKGESKQVLKLIYSLKENPHKGKELTQIDGILIKELRYNSFRFYFIVDGHRIKVLDDKKLVDLIIKILAMSDKKSQQETIEKIKNLLRSFGREALKGSF